MSRREKGRGFYCRNKYFDAESECADMQYETEKDLEDVVFHAIMLYIKNIGLTAENRKKLRRKNASGALNLMGQMSDLQKKEEHIRNDKLRHYEDYVSGSLSREAYIRSKSSADEELHSLREEMSQLEVSISDGQQKLTNEMAMAFVKAVYIHSDGHIDIQFRFKDTLEDHVE